MNDSLLLAAARAAILSLREDEFRETVEVGGTVWDVYTHAMPDGSPMDAVTLALRLERGNCIIGSFCPGRPSIEEIRARLAKDEGQWQ